MSHVSNAHVCCVREDGWSPLAGDRELGRPAGRAGASPVDTCFSLRAPGGAVRGQDPRRRPPYLRAASLFMSILPATSCRTFVSAMPSPSIVTTKRLAASEFSSPCLLSLLHFSQPG